VDESDLWISRLVDEEYVRLRSLVTPPYQEVVAEVQSFIHAMVQRTLEAGSEARWDPAEKRWI